MVLAIVDELKLISISCCFLSAGDLILAISLYCKSVFAFARSMHRGILGTLSVLAAI